MNEHTLPVGDLPTQLRALLDGERDFAANAANAAALIYDRLPDLNWAGFYLLRGTQLVLGPFQGKPACARIELGRGVCGTAAARRETIVVPDVRRFPGHIACDAASQAEVVVPLLARGRLLGVLDVDSPQLDRFGETEVRLLEAAVNVLLEASNCETETDRGEPPPPPRQTEAALAFQRLVVAGRIREAYERFVAADMRHHNASFRGDRESLRQAMEENHARFPHKTLVVRQTLAEDDRVAIFSEVRLEPDGPRVAMFHLFRFCDGKIVELWDVGHPVPDDSPNENGPF